MGRNGRRFIFNVDFARQMQPVMTARQHVSLMLPRRTFDRRFPDACRYIRRFDIGHERSAQFPIRLERRNSPAPGVLCIRLVFAVAHSS